MLQTLLPLKLFLNEPKSDKRDHSTTVPPFVSCSVLQVPGYWQKKLTDELSFGSVHIAIAVPAWCAELDSFISVRHAPQL
jgi:hypothetical protein